MQKKELKKVPQVKKKAASMIVKPEKYDIPKVVEELKTREKLSLESLINIITEASSILKNEPTLLKLESPYIIVGDIHGQFYDLLNIFRKFGFPPLTNYVFLGDYVDRGRFCIEVLTLLLVLKVNYPSSIYLLRGNHEGRVMTTAYNFKTECETKYNSLIYQKFMDFFTCFPLCALIDKRYFAVHGGISPQLNKINELDKLNRFCEIGQGGLICDLLWSDPSEQISENWKNNDNRSCSYFYSKKQSERFLKNNSLKLIIRGHQVQMQGFKYQCGAHNESLALTIFSAPRYCDTYFNKGAVAILDKRCLSLQTYKEVEHPFVMANYLNAVQLSFPFMAAEVTKIFAYLLKHKRSNIRVKDPAISHAIEEVSTIEDVLSKHATELRYIVKTTSKIASDLQNGSDTISQSLMKFFEKECYSANQKCPLAIFGPKQIPFVKVRVSVSQEQDEHIEGQV